MFFFFSGAVGAAENIASNVRVFSEQLIVVNAEGRDFFCLEVLWWYLPAGIDKLQIPQGDYPVSAPTLIHQPYRCVILFKCLD
jgi:hypothetical protein